MDKLRVDLSSSEQSVVKRLKDQLVVGGWSVVEEVSNTSSDVDFAFSSPTSDPSNYGPLYVRVRGYNGYIELYGYESYINSTTVSGELHDSTYSKVLVPSGEFRYWLFTGLDAVKIVMHDTGADKVYHGYAGRLESIYPTTLDSVPLVVFATSTDSSHWGDGVSTRVLDYVGSTTAATPWTVLDATASGSSFCAGFSTASLVLTSSGSYPEVRGVVPGVCRVHAEHAPTGYSFVTSSGTYYSFSKSGAVAVGYAYGPVTNPSR